MLELYTPKEWNSLFGGAPMLIIDDEGYIYNREDYYKLISGEAIGWIDFETGAIYGERRGILAEPIGYIRKKDQRVLEIYDRTPGFLTEPILYIDEGKIYTREEYTKLFDGTPTGYVKENNPPTGKGPGKTVPGNAETPKKRMPAIRGELGIFLVVVAVLLSEKIIRGLYDMRGLVVSMAALIVCAGNVDFVFTITKLKKMKMDQDSMKQMEKYAWQWTAAGSVIPAAVWIWNIGTGWAPFLMVLALISLTFCGYGIFRLVLNKLVLKSLPCKPIYQFRFSDFRRKRK